ncbi:hypothetical protein PIB30_096640 [Stylosanthes scabra]|uniref:Uncharacterized protein n=1 Tax=Stylosanthes scabra TaxID=79078 RepID=A0ABU6SWE0_9FABA|nr:hypothetical protein [Stylosanthes scabra]
MKLNSSLATNESVCSSGVGFDEGIKVGSHIKQLGSARKEEYMNLKDKVSKLDRRQCSSTPTLEIGPGMSDGDEDFMPSLKELNEAQELKRREAKKKGEGASLFFGVFDKVFSKENVRSYVLDASVCVRVGDFRVLLFVDLYFCILISHNGIVEGTNLGY